jgi:hypothetical protein
MPMPPTRRRKRGTNAKTPALTVADFYRRLLTTPASTTNPTDIHQEYLAAAKS